MLRLRYDTDEARTMAAKISAAMRDDAYKASVALARERGAFPLSTPTCTCPGQLRIKLRRN